MKRKRMNKFLSLFVTLAMLMSMLTVPAAADDTDTALKGGETISTGGTYQLADGATGTITVATTDAVKLVGGYALDENWAETADSKKYSALTIDAAGAPGAKIELENVAITSPASSTQALIDFSGEGNTLTFTGTNLLEFQPSGYSGQNAGIHVGKGTALTINGAGTLFLYKSASGAGIGGASSKVNGDITFAMTGSLFAKGTKQSALIGAGAKSTSDTAVPGFIKFESGVYNLIANSQGAAIGGSAGSDGGSAGTAVYVSGNANVNINADYSGAAVGGGGYAEGNDASGGTLYVTGGSLRTYVDKNAASNVTGYGGVALTEGVNDTVITAARKNASGDNVYKCVVDTSGIEAAANGYTVTVDGTTYYTGGLHSYHFVNESLDKSDQAAITTTPANWTANTDPNLYFYLTGEDHEITVNGKKLTAKYESGRDAAAVCTEGAFTVSGSSLPGGNPQAAVWDGTLDFSWYDENDVKTEYHLSTPAQWEALAWICSEHLGELSELGEGTYTNGNVTGITGTVPSAQNMFAGVQFYLDSDLDMGGVYDAASGSWSGQSYYPVGSQVSDDKGKGTWYGTFLGKFNGQGHIVKNIYCNRVDSEGDYKASQSAGLFGRVGMPDSTDYNKGSDDIIIENVAVTGFIKIGRSAGGIVGKTLHVADGKSIVVKNCINFADVSTVNGAKGVGGVVGTLWNGASVDSCANFGTVTGTYRSANGAGISGAAEGPTSNSYNVGTVTNTVKADNVGAVALNNTTADVTNSYALEGSAPGYTSSILNGKTLVSGGWKTAEEMKSWSFAETLGEGWVLPVSTDTISTIMESAGVTGYPVPAAFTSHTEHNFENGACTVCGKEGTAPVQAEPWDGKTIDVSWYNTTDKEFHITTPAQFMGLAAIVNGKYNSTITTVIGDDDHTKIVASEVKFASTTGGNNEGWRGADTFEGKTVYLDADLDMGGVYNEATGKWSGALYMPVSGAYYLDDGTSLNSIWGGVLDGQGHKVYNVYASYSCSSWSACVGLVGRMGAHDNDPVSARPTGAVVRNVIVDGYIDSDRSTGGIVGKIGKTSGGALIENCINLATIVGHQSKGTGGICGAAWNGGTIRNCLNAGKVSNSYKTTGGLAGSHEIALINSYNIGTVTGNGSGSVSGDTAGGTYTNIYWQTGTSNAGALYVNSDQVIEKSKAYLQSADFLKDINAGGRAWVAGTAENSPLEAGYPIPRTLAGPDTATVTGVTVEGAAKTAYVEGQAVDLDTLKILKQYSDNTQEPLEDYEIMLGGVKIASDYKVTAEDAGKTITVSGTVEGYPYSYESAALTVEQNYPVEITRMNQNMASAIYGVGDTISVDGMRAYVVFSNGEAKWVVYGEDENLTFNLSNPLTKEDSGKELIFTYTMNGRSAECTVKTKSGTDAEAVKLEVLPEVEVIDDVYQIKTTDDLRLFTAKVNNGGKGLNAILINDLDFSEIPWTPIGNSANTYSGTFDGNGKTVTLNHNITTSTTGFFSYVSTGTVKNLTIAGTISGNGTVGAIAGRLNGAGTIENCVNKATITCTGQTNGGIVGEASSGSSIIGCRNEGSVTGTNNIGGILGRGSASITNCENAGTVKSTGTAGAVGGIVGLINSPNVTLEACANTGDVTGLVNVGGIAGSIYKDTIKNSYNTGTVSATGSSTARGAGGIVGGYVSNSAGAVIENCYNGGTVAGENVKSAAILGFDNKGATLTNCYFLGSSEDAAHNVTGSTATTANDTVYAKTADELKAAGMAALLGEAFDDGKSDVNSGYPTLGWQNEVNITYTAGLATDDTAVDMSDSNNNAFTVDVQLSASEAAQLAAGSFNISYNENVAFVSGTGSSALTGTTVEISPSGENALKLTMQGAAQNYGTEPVTIATLTFRAVKEGSAQIAFGDDCYVAAPDAGAAKLPVDTTATAARTIENNIGEVSIISNADYNALPDGYVLVKFMAETKNDESAAWLYGDTPMYYAEQLNADGKYAYLALVKEENLTAAKAKEKISSGSGSQGAVDYDGDVNGDGSIDILDAQNAYDLSRCSDSAYYRDFSILDEQARLEADINRDGTVTTSDARAIQYFVHYGTFTVA